MEIWVDGAGSLIEGQRWKTAVVFGDGDYWITEGTGIVTNNEAEYRALIEALLDGRSENATIYTDSQLLVGHLTKNWKVNADNLKKFVEIAKKLLNLANAKLVWVPRNKNKAGQLLESKKV